MGFWDVTEMVVNVTIVDRKTNASGENPDLDRSWRRSWWWPEASGKPLWFGDTRYKFNRTEKWGEKGWVSQFLLCLRLNLRVSWEWMEVLLEAWMSRGVVGDLNGSKFYAAQDTHERIIWESGNGWCLCERYWCSRWGHLPSGGSFWWKLGFFVIQAV